MSTQGLEATSDWTDIVASLSLAEDDEVLLQNIGLADLWLVEASAEPGDDFYGILLHRGEWLEWVIGSDKLFVKSTRSRGTRLAVNDVV